MFRQVGLLFLLAFLLVFLTALGVASIILALWLAKLI